MRLVDGAQYRWLVAQVTSTTGGKFSREGVLMVALGVGWMSKHKKRRMRGNDQWFFGCYRGSIDHK